MIIEHKGDLHPQIVSKTKDGKIARRLLPARTADIEVEEGAEDHAGTVLAKTPRESGGTQDITGGLPRVTEIFEARKPKDPAVIAEIDGEVEILARRNAASERSSSAAKAASNASTCAARQAPPGAHRRHVKAGEALVDGPLVPHDILRVSGEEAVQQYLLHEIQKVYRSQRVEINDKHIEIIIARMLRKVKIETPATPTCCPAW
jgi:DNA-directed RNA polymerase subunit beta'